LTALLPLRWALRRDPSPARAHLRLTPEAPLGRDQGFARPVRRLPRARAAGRAPRIAALSAASGAYERTTSDIPCRAHPRGTVAGSPAHAFDGDPRGSPARVRRRVSPPRPRLPSRGLAARAPEPDSPALSSKRATSARPGTPSTARVLLTAVRTDVSTEPATFAAWLSPAGRLPAPSRRAPRLRESPVARTEAASARFRPRGHPPSLRRSSASAVMTIRERLPRIVWTRAALARSPPRSPLGGSVPLAGLPPAGLLGSGESAAAFAAPHPPPGGPGGMTPNPMLPSTPCRPGPSRRPDSPARRGSRPNPEPLSRSRAKASTRPPAALREETPTETPTEERARNDGAPPRRGAPLPSPGCFSIDEGACLRPPGIHRLSPTCGQMTGVPRYLGFAARDVGGSTEDPEARVRGRLAGGRTTKSFPTPCGAGETPCHPDPGRARSRRAPALLQSQFWCMNPKLQYAFKI